MQKHDDTENWGASKSKSFSILGLYVSITSWIIRIVGIVIILVFFLGLYNIFSGGNQSLGWIVVLGCVGSAVVLGGVAVLFRLSEQANETNQQLLEIKTFLHQKNS